MSKEDDVEVSFHGKLIGIAIEHWSQKILFEQNDMTLRNGLELLLNNYLPTIKKNITWDMNPELIDKGGISGFVAFLDENEIMKVLNFHIFINDTKIEEHEEN